MDGTWTVRGRYVDDVTLNNITQQHNTTQHTVTNVADPGGVLGVSDRVSDSTNDSIHEAAVLPLFVLEW